jgi:hypothetical protein
MSAHPNGDIAMIGIPTNSTPAPIFAMRLLAATPTPDGLVQFFRDLRAESAAEAASSEELMAEDDSEAGAG